MEHSTDDGAFCSCWGTELVTIHDGSQGSPTYRYRGILIIDTGAGVSDEFLVVWPLAVDSDDGEFRTIEAAKAAIDQVALAAK